MSKRKMITLSAYELNQRLANAHKQGISDGVSGILAATVIVIHDKYGFEKEQCIKLLDEINEQFDSVDKGFLSIDDIRSTVLDELGIDIR